MLSLSILVVEDNEAFRRFICSVLQQRAEFQVSGEAANGLEAVHIAEGLQPDLILLDIGLPQLDGLEAGRRIRKVSPGSKILFVSQESSPEVMQEALSLGAQGYISKTHAHDLLFAIDTVLGGERFVNTGVETVRARFEGSATISKHATAESFLSAEKRMLEAIAKRMSLPEVLDDLCRTIEAHAPGVISSVALVDPDGKRLWLGAGPRFPIELRVVFPWPIGPGMGACGTAAFLKRRVIISDIKIDPRWPNDCRDFPVSLGLRAAWSEPLVSKDGAVLGTFAMYYGEPRVPDAGDLELIEAAGHIALIAIEMERSQAALRDSEERFRLVANTAPVMIWMSGVDKVCTYINQRWLEFTGRSSESELASGWAGGIHPEDVPKCLETYTQSFDRREPFQVEYRLRRYDGEYRWILDHGVPRFTADGSFAGYIGSGIDVTDRKLTEAALQKSDERLRLAMESGRSVGWDWDVKSGRDSLFGDLQSLFGIPADVYDGRVEDFHRYVHPGDRRRVVQAVKDAMLTHQPYAAEFRLRWPDGTERWLAAKGKFHYSKDGQAERMLGMGVDITDRKLTEQELDKANERLRLSIEAGSIGGWDFNVKTCENVWLGEAHSHLGMTSDETLGSLEDFWARVHEEDRERLHDAIRLAMDKHESFNEEFRVVWRDGTIHWLRSRGRYYYDANGEPERMLGISLDITQRRCAEQALRRNEAYLTEAQRMAHVGSWGWGVSASEAFWSQEQFCLLGYVPEEMSPSLSRFLERVHPEDRSRVEQVVNELKSGSGADIVSDYRIVRTDGTVKHLHSIAHPVKNASGEVVEVVGTSLDVTERKLAEEALARASQKLVEAQEQERTRIAQELHDDINQRIALLSVRLEGLRQNLPASASEIKSQIGAATEQISDLGTDIQALSHRLHSPKLELLGLAAAAASYCREFGDLNKVKIDFESERVPRELPPEVSLSLYRVLQEALQNATKHSGSRHFQVSLRGRTDQIELKVHDSGVGFGIEEAIKGRGLGLTSMTERVRLVDGHLSIDSAPRRGTTLRAVVPVSPRRAQAAG